MAGVYNPDFSAMPPEDDEETDDMDVNAQLSAMPGLGGMYQSVLAGRQKRLDLSKANASQMWQNYRDQLTQERVGPSKLERVAAALSAFGAAPTRNGNFFQALNAANRSMQETGAEAAAADRARKKALADLSFKQAQAVAEQEETGASGMESLQIAAIKAAASANKGTGTKVTTGVSDSRGYAIEKFPDNSVLARFGDGTVQPINAPPGSMAATALASNAPPAAAAPVAAPAAAGRPAGVPATWILQEDKDGNKAYVSPDGTQFKEVP